MQHTTKYKFNLIETSDTFSPDALNANAEAVEKELAALASAHAADKAALEKADTDNKAALQTTINNNKTDTDASIKTLNTAISALQTAIGSGGKTCRISTGSYVGTGTFGSDHKNKLTFEFKPLLVFITSSFTAYVIAYLRSNAKVDTVVTEWGDKEMVWYTPSGPDPQQNHEGITYYYVAIGESL